jgi:hypothetical protein
MSLSRRLQSRSGNAIFGRCKEVSQPNGWLCYLLNEMVRLEKDPKTGKIDHPPHGSKDCAHAVAGVVHGLTMRREFWAHFGIPIVSAPPSINSGLGRTKRIISVDSRTFTNSFLG